MAVIDPSLPLKQETESPTKLFVISVLDVKVTEEFSGVEQISSKTETKYVSAQALFNIEVKFHPQLVDHFYPTVDTYVKLLVDLIEKHEMSERVIIQSFDYDILRKTRELNPSLFISALNDKEIPVKECFSNLGFTPDAFGPNFELLNRQSVEYCKGLGVKVIPWTVNEIEDMKRMIESGVDGIITDYPNRIELLEA